mgnify:CR=1 FL=1
MDAQDTIDIAVYLRRNVDHIDNAHQSDELTWHGPSLSEPWGSVRIIEEAACIALSELLEIKKEELQKNEKLNRDALNFLLGNQVIYKKCLGCHIV